MRRHDDSIMLVGLALPAAPPHAESGAHTMNAATALRGCPLLAHKADIGQRVPG
jgi:hypothetical protein